MSNIELFSKVKLNSPILKIDGETVTLNAVHGDGSKQGGYVIMDCFDASGKMLKADL